VGEHGQRRGSRVSARSVGEVQIDAGVVAKAKPGALVMHCLPAYRGKEISEEVLEAHAMTIFDQAENRLHAQKAVLSLLARG
jgi:ornithine carbamoyltransferase